MTKGVHLPRVTAFCAKCERKFSRIGSDLDRKYCSDSCKRQGGAAKAPRQLLCAHCQQSYVQTSHKQNQRYCSISCARIGQGLKRKAEYRARGWWANYREAKADILQLIGCCEHCRWKEHKEVLELHHKDCDRKNNSRSNLALLCPNCHTWEHFTNKTGQFRQLLKRGLTNPH